MRSGMQLWCHTPALPTSTPITFPGSAATLLCHLAAFGSAVETKQMENGNFSQGSHEFHLKKDHVMITYQSKVSDWLKREEIPLENVMGASSYRNDQIIEFSSHQRPGAPAWSATSLSFLPHLQKRCIWKFQQKTLIHKYFCFEADEWNEVMLSSCWILAELKVLEPFVLFAATSALHFTSTSFSTWDIGLLSTRQHKRLNSHRVPQASITQRYKPRVFLMEW